MLRDIARSEVHIAQARFSLCTLECTSATISHASVEAVTLANDEQFPPLTARGWKGWVVGCCLSSSCKSD